MSQIALNHVWENSSANGNALLVLLAIAEKADHKVATIHANKLAAMTRLNEKELFKIIAQCAEFQAIKVLQKPGLESLPCIFEINGL